MKKLFKAFMIAGLLGLGSIAAALPIPQTATNSGGSSALSLEGGAILYAELSKTLDAKKVKPGDPVIALLLADVLSHGKIVAHRDSKLIGHITEVKQYTKEDSESRLGIVFEKIRFKGGEEVPFSSVLMALHPAPRPTLDPPPSGPNPPINPTSTVGSDRRSPVPAGSPKRPSNPNSNPNSSKEVDSSSRAIAQSGPTDIDGLSLISSGSGGAQAVVSRSRMVKLESGVVIELRVTAPAGQ